MGEINQVLYRMSGDQAERVDEWIIDSTNYNIVGRFQWEVAEQQMLKAFKALKLKPGTYRLDAISAYSSTTVVTVTRELPMPKAYLELPYGGSQDKPSRAYIWTLHDCYEGSTLGLVAEHYEEFDAHYYGQLSSDALHAATGYPARSSAYVVTGTRDTQPTQLRHRFTSLEPALLLAESKALTGWKDVQVWHDGRLIATFEVADHASTVLEIQFRMLPDFKRPYPFFIHDDGQVGRQDFWKGKVSKLVGFQPDLDAQELVLNRQTFWEAPEKAIGLTPTFVDDNDGWFGMNGPVDHVIRHVRVARNTGVAR